jgi:hypothetical protein
MLNNREWAILIWSVGILSILMVRREICSSIVDLFRTLIEPQILIPLFGMTGYVALEVWLGYKAWLWRSEFTKDTIIWFVISALALFFRFDRASKQPHFFRRRLVAAFSITVFLEFFTNLFVLNLIAELLLQPFLVILALLAAMAESDDRLRIMRKPLNALLAVIGLSLFLFSVRQVFLVWSQLDKPAVALQAALPIWLTIGLLPYIYLLSLYANYQSAFNAIDAHTKNRQARQRAKLALVTSLQFRTRDSYAFGGWPWLDRIVSATDFRAARRVVADFQTSRRENEREIAEEQERLRRYAGSSETDADGRRLDRREFEQTMEALRWLADCMEGWYHNEDHGGKRYRADLWETLGSDFFRPDGLPPDPPIIMKVAKKGGPGMPGAAPSRAGASPSAPPGLHQIGGRTTVQSHLDASHPRVGDGATGPIETGRFENEAATRSVSRNRPHTAVVSRCPGRC